MFYCAACRSKQVPVDQGLCEKCAVQGLEPGRFAYHEVDGFSLVKKNMMVLNASIESLRDEAEGYDKLGSDPEAQDRKQAVMKRMAELARAVAMLAKEARAYEAHAVKTAKTMTNSDKMAVFLPWFAKLPPDSKRTLCQQMIQMCNEDGSLKRKA